jgi:hypothetical protein
MADNRIRKLSWLAPLALVAAGGLAACGDKVVSETGTDASVEASRGSDQHLYNQASEIEARSEVLGSDVHLYNQAADIEARSEVVGSDVHLYNQAAEIARAKAQALDVAETSDTDAMPNPWEAGNRAVEQG